MVQPFGKRMLFDKSTPLCSSPSFDKVQPQEFAFLLPWIIHDCVVTYLAKGT